MARYIDAEKAEKDGWSASRIYPYDAKTNVYETKKMTDFPTADVREEVHAHWEDWSFLGWDMETHWRRRCSNCLCEREDDNEEKDTPFCPNCGARMDERREDDDNTL